MGLPNAVPGTSPEAVLEWARRADHAPFSTIGVVDRVGYESYEPLSVLAAAAAVTARVKLTTMVLIGPLRSPAVLAKETSTVNEISGGRLVLGLGLGARRDDYARAGVPYAGRGRRLSRQIATLRDAWEGAVTGPVPGSLPPPRVLVGGASDATFGRVARYADGYVHGGGPPRAFARAAERVRAAWRDGERPGEPLLWGQGYFALGDHDTVERGRAYMLDYYGFTGSFSEKIAEGMLGTPQSVIAFVKGYADAGCDEVVLFPAVAETSQLDRLADALTGL